MRGSDYLFPWCAYKHMTMDGRILYIGKGRLSRAGDLSPSRRSAYHLRAIKKHCQLALVIAVAPFMTEREAFEAEREWIAKARADGHKLCNFTDGGEGASGAVKSPDTRKKLRDAALRQWDRRGRAAPKAAKSGVAICACCGADIHWRGRAKKVCSKRCESALYRKPYAPSPRRPGASGVRGVYPAGNGRWKAGVTVSGAYRHLGTFDTIEAAIAARREAE